jgi:uncharacterized Zn-binding protein involved in type VI secretion
MNSRVALIAAIAAALLPSPASAAVLQPIDPSVDGGEEAWHADPSFALRWSNPPGVAAVRYRLLDPSGLARLLEARIGWATTAIQHLTVPDVSGAYTAEVWLEDESGAEAQPVAVKLRFDDIPPGEAPPKPMPAWIGRNDFPISLSVGHPAGPEPLSGIRGYALSIDREPDGKPCEGTTSCQETETDLRAGVDGDSLPVADLAEGVSYVHAVAVSGSGIRSSAVGSTPLRVDETDPTTQLEAIPFGWSSKPLTLVATATDDGSGMTATGGAGAPFTAIRVDDRVPVVAAGDRVSATVVASGSHTVAFYARDLAGNTDDGARVNGVQNSPPRTAVVRIDRDSPALGFSNSQDPADPERIEAHVSDPLSGIDPGYGTIAVRPAGSAARFGPLPTQVTGSRLIARWDSEAYPPGEYEFRATARDRAGNIATTTARDDGSAMKLHNPIKVPTRLSLAPHRAAAGTTLSCNGSVSLGGQLVAGRRVPLPGRPIRIVERFASGSVRKERETTIRTDGRGRFRLDLRPGPTREVIALAPPTPTQQGARSAPISLAARACVSLRVSSPVAKIDGRPIVFRGHVRSPGAEVPRHGLSVQLQFRLPGLRWSEFRTVETDGRGFFRYPYRFADDDSRGVRFRFRAFVAARAGWPFEPAGSPPVQVLGR